MDYHLAPHETRRPTESWFLLTELKSGLYLFYFDSDLDYHLRSQGYSSGTICCTPSGKGAESCKCLEAVLTVQVEEPGLSSLTEGTSAPVGFGSSITTVS
jgi:hypothetical protein